MKAVGLTTDAAGVSVAWISNSFIHLGLVLGLTRNASTAKPAMYGAAQLLPPTLS